MARLWRMKCGLEKVERSCRAQLRLAVQCRALQWSCRIANDWQILQQAAGLAAWLAGRAAVSETELGLEIEMSGWFVQRWSKGSPTETARLSAVCLLLTFGSRRAVASRKKKNQNQKISPIAFGVLRLGSKLNRHGLC
jgi:hypothetical protein